MRFPSWVLLILSLSLIASTAAAQPESDGPGPNFRFRDGGAGGMMQSIFIPPKPNAPFSLVLYTEWSKPQETGGSITLTNQRRIARDSSGRIYQERRFLVPKGSGQESQLRIFQISDPAQHIWYGCDPRTKICDVHLYVFQAMDNYAPAIATSSALPHGRGFRQSDDLGLSSTAGVETHGYREVTTFNPGVLGNDRPVKALREIWYSPQLAIDLLSIVDQPMSGKQVFTARDVSTSEPDPALFEIPPDYKVVDHRSQETENIE